MTRFYKACFIYCFLLVSIVLPSNSTEENVGFYGERNDVVRKTTSLPILNSHRNNHMSFENTSGLRGINKELKKIVQDGMTVYSLDLSCCVLAIDLLSPLYTNDGERYYRKIMLNTMKVPGLTRLNLSRNNIDNTYMKMSKIFLGLINHPTLKELDLSYNLITDLEELFNSVQSIQLTKLVLTGNLCLKKKRQINSIRARFPYLSIVVR